MEPKMPRGAQSPGPYEMADDGHSATEAAMTVSGEDAKNWDAVRYDTMMPVNKGPLISCDDQDGKVVWQGRDGEVTETLGQGRVVLVRKGRG